VTLMAYMNFSLTLEQGVVPSCLDNGGSTVPANGAPVYTTSLSLHVRLQGASWLDHYSEFATTWLNNCMHEMICFVGNRFSTT